MQYSEVTVKAEPDDRPSFTNGQPRVFTERDLQYRWGLNSKRRGILRCSLCGHTMAVGEIWRWVYCLGASHDIGGKIRGVSNASVCASCDGPDVIDRWVALHKEFYSDKFWALRGHDAD